MVTDHNITNQNITISIQQFYKTEISHNQKYYDINKIFSSMYVIINIFLYYLKVHSIHLIF